MSVSPAKKKASAKKPAEHPKYIEMITQAIMALKERTGSSRQAILKYIKENFKVGDNVDVHVKMALKRGVASGALAQPKGTGASGSFKAVKKVATPKTPVKKTAAKKPAKKPVAKKTPAKKAKKPAAKKPATKKFTPKKPVAKKLAAKKPAAKKPTANMAKKKPAKKPAAKKAAKKPAKK